MENSLYKKYESLKKIISAYEKAVVAFSGGVDSTFLLKTTYDVLGENTVSITIQSPAHTEKEIKAAKEYIKDLKIRSHSINILLTSFPAFIDNPSDRCYHCKKEIFSKIREIAKNEGIETVFDGSNADDLLDYRPGMKALEELNIISPLVKANLSKNDIRILSKEFSLPTWDKPANPCLATRIPYNSKITQGKLNQIERAEEILFNLGLKICRVRHHGNIARIEVERKDWDIIKENVDFINKNFKELGFKYIALDLKGFRSGSLNEALE